MQSGILKKYTNELKIDPQLIDRIESDFVRV